MAEELSGPLAVTFHALATNDLDAVLADPRVDRLDICLPPMLHVPVALKALAAGKQVDFVRRNWLRLGVGLALPNDKHSPFRYFRTNPAIIRLAVMMCVRCLLSLRSVEEYPS